MTETSRRPYTWTILSDIKRQLNQGAAREIERLSGESTERQSRSAERTWWMSH